MIEEDKQTAEAWITNQTKYDEEQKKRTPSDLLEEQIMEAIEEAARGDNGNYDADEFAADLNLLKIAHSTPINRDNWLADGYNEETLRCLLYWFKTARGTAESMLPASSIETLSADNCVCFHGSSEARSAALFHFVVWNSEDEVSLACTHHLKQLIADMLKTALAAEQKQRGVHIGHLLSVYPLISRSIICASFEEAENDLNCAACQVEVMQATAKRDEEAEDSELLAIGSNMLDAAMNSPNNGIRGISCAADQRAVNASYVRALAAHYADLARSTQTNGPSGEVYDHFEEIEDFNMIAAVLRSAADSIMRAKTVFDRVSLASPLINLVNSGAAIIDTDLTLNDGDRIALTAPHAGLYSVVLYCLSEEAETAEKTPRYVFQVEDTQTIIERYETADAETAAILFSALVKRYSPAPEAE